MKIELGEGKATVEREVEGAHEVWETSLPAVLSAQKGLNEPRYASLKGIMAAKKKTIQTMDAAVLGLKAEDLAAKTRVVALELPPARPGVKMIPGDVVSMYATAKDARTKASTDILFAEAQPFDHRFQSAFAREFCESFRVGPGLVDRQPMRPVCDVPQLVDRRFSEPRLILQESL